MKYFLKVADCISKPNSHNEMIYKNDLGEVFFGPTREVITGNTYLVEVTSKLPEDGHYEIIKFVPG
jgi:hypothetical protein